MRTLNHWEGNTIKIILLKAGRIDRKLKSTFKILLKAPMAPLLSQDWHSSHKGSF